VCAQIDPGCLSALATLANPHVDVDRAALETPDLPKSTSNESSVLRVKESGGEENERRGTRRGLRTKQDARLAPTANRMRMFGGQLGKKRVELAGRDARVPRLESGLERLAEMLTRGAQAT
jgi:hypothetical protein